MADISSTDQIEFFHRLAELEVEKKRVQNEIKESIDNFVSSHLEEGDSPKVVKEAVKSAYKKYQKLSKDRAEFILLEAELDRLTERLLDED